MPDDPPTIQLLERVQAGDDQALNLLLSRHRGLLKRYVEARIDPQLRQRVDPSDIVQEALLEIARRIGNFLERQPMPFHVWLRKTTYQNLLQIRRQHAAEQRTPSREVALPDASSILLVRKLFEGQDNPLRRLLDEEMSRRISEAVAQLGEMDREVLMLRHFEDLGNQEIASLLDLEEGTVSKRYGRALLRLRKLLVEQGILEPGR